MARKSRDEIKFNYGDEVRLLKENGPKRLYFIWGPEDYLSEIFVGDIKKVCLPEGEDDFTRIFTSVMTEVSARAEAEQAIEKKK